jgi:hypothetical protein
MARMMPLHIGDDNPSRAERELFEEFRDACPDEWTVLHSLDVAKRWKDRPFGEADFVVLVPGAGILCLEAKSYVYRDADGMWHYEPNGPGTPRSPFDQASGAMWAVLDWLGKRGAPRVVAASAVIVPDMDVRSDGGGSIEWGNWQLIDRGRYLSKSLERHVLDCLDAQRALLSDPPAPMSREDAAKITRMLRAEVECYESPRARIERATEEAKRYTDEQFKVLDLFGDNPRFLVNGLAGTGKTLLAIEIVRRAVSSGQRVLLACFNTMLGEWLTQEIEPLGNACTAGTVHEFMREITGDDRSAPADDDMYWSETLPVAALEVLTDPNSAFKPFDLIVLDEAQDVIATDAYLNVLDAALVQGLARGRWVFLGDFARQAIYKPLDGSPQEVLERFIGYQPPVVRLDKNCRNTPRVSHAAGSIAGFSAGEGYRQALREDDGREPLVLFYDGEKTRVKQLLRALEALHSDGFHPGEIVVLSRRSIANCSAGQIDSQPWRDRLKPLEHAGATHAGYDSIYRFKGREAPAVVLCDIDPLGDWRTGMTEDDVRGLLYVGVTRAVSRVAIVAHESWRGVLDLAPMDEFAVTNEDLAAVGEAVSDAD